MFQTLNETPPKGSLRESVLLLYVMKREEIEYMRDLALVQMMVDKKAGAEKFDEYRKVMFPWIETAKKRDEDQYKKMLNDVVKRGPLTIRSMHNKPVRSRLVQRMRETPQPTNEQTKKNQDELYKKLGKLIPV